MVKRKVSHTNGDVKSTKKSKKPEADLCKLDTTSATSTISSLLAPTTLETFFEEHWEKKHLHIKRNDKDFYGGLFSLESMKEMLEEQELEFETDVNVCRYVNGEKELLNEEGQITIKEFNKLMKDEKATFQVHQPQRFNDGLWKVMEKIETHFGSLVGANVYITPADSQGLAPHCDDVEIFVLQLEGKKTWKLYKPMVELSRDYTQDLMQDSIGEPIFEVTLEPGDLLYFPRGTIHQAKTTSDGHSTHISISTYQQHTWGDFMDHAVRLAIENAMEDDVEFRRGLPLNYLNFLGTGKDMSKYVEDEEEEKEGETKKKEKISNEGEEKVKKFKETIKQYLSKLVDHIDVNKAADAMSSDFMASRLPPFGHVPPEVTDEDEKPPTLENKIKVKYPEHVRVVYLDDEEEDDENVVDMSQLDDDEDDSEMEEDEEVKEEKPKANGNKKGDEKAKKTTTPGKRKSKGGNNTEDEEEEDDEDAETNEELPCIAVVHSLNNERDLHMTGPPADMRPSTLKLPVHFASAAVSLLNSKDFVCVKDIELDEDDDKLRLATVLFADDLIEIQ